MSTATRQTNGNGAHYAEPQTQAEVSRLLDQVISQTESKKAKIIADALSSESTIQKLEDVLPDNMKGQAKRLVKRAMITFARVPKLQECTTASFIRCVLEAAEAGLAIDGKLGHAVPYSTKVKRDGKDSWEMQAQFQPDYKGLVAIAKRNGVVKDVRASVVCKGDHFDFVRTHAGDTLEHRYHLGEDRGPVIGAYAIFDLPDGGHHFEVMGREELDAIEAKSKSKDRDGNSFGPWKTDRAEMQRKTVVKRGLKFFAEDPAMARAMEADDREYISEIEPASAPQLPAPGVRTSLRRPRAAEPVQQQQPEEEVCVDNLDQSNGEYVELSRETHDALLEMGKQLGLAANDWSAWTKRVGARSVGSLSQDQADELLALLGEEAKKREAV